MSGRIGSITDPQLACGQCLPHHRSSVCRSCRITGLPYADAAVGSFILYVLIGASVARRTNRSFGFVAGLTAGFADATAGWWLSWLIGPGRPSSGSIKPTEWLLTVVALTALACVFAGLSGVTATLGRSRIQD
jgi:hypothetical protein